MSLTREEDLLAKLNLSSEDQLKIKNGRAFSGSVLRGQELDFFRQVLATVQAGTPSEKDIALLRSKVPNSLKDRT
jgi:hypothetical protein